MWRETTRDAEKKRESKEKEQKMKRTETSAANEESDKVWGNWVGESETREWEWRVKPAIMKRNLNISQEQKLHSGRFLKAAVLGTPPASAATGGKVVSRDF